MLQESIGGICECEGCLEVHPIEDLIWISIHNIEQLICSTCKNNHDEHKRQDLEKDRLSILNALDNDEIW